MKAWDSLRSCASVVALPAGEARNSSRSCWRPSSTRSSRSAPARSCSAMKLAMRIPEVVSTSAAIRRARSELARMRSITLAHQPEARRTYGFDRRRLSVHCELPAEVVDVDGEHVGARVIVVAPHGGEDLLA